VWFFENETSSGAFPDQIAQFNMIYANTGTCGSSIFVMLVIYILWFLSKIGEDFPNFCIKFLFSWEMPYLVLHERGIAGYCFNL
jgi:hypothetical protein